MTTVDIEDSVACFHACITWLCVKTFSNERKVVNVVSESSICRTNSNNVEVCWCVGRDKRCRTELNKVEILDEDKVI
jgi:hypothetical protein